MVELYQAPASEGKFDKRKHTLGNVTHFNLYGEIIPSDPWTLTFNWNWCKAVYDNRELHHEIIKYYTFTDLVNKLHRSEFGCYAESASMYVALHRIGLLDKAMPSVKVFADYDYGVKI